LNRVALAAAMDAAEPENRTRNSEMAHCFIACTSMTELD
jgi:hypothetical protein